MLANNTETIEYSSLSSLLLFSEIRVIAKNNYKFLIYRDK